MKSGKISWEIILAGLTFIGIAIFLINREPTSSHSENPHRNPAKADAPLPSSVVIDLSDLKSLENLEKLKDLKLDKLEIKLKDLDKAIQQKKHESVNKAEAGSLVDKTIEQLKTQLQQIDKGKYRVKLQSGKLYINKQYNLKNNNWSEVSPGVYAFRKTFDTGELQSVMLKIGSGNINIVGSSSDEGELLLQATGSVENPAKLADKLPLNETVSNGTATFTLSTNQENYTAERLNVEATLTLPEKLDVQVTTQGGHITASSLNGNHTFKTSGGHISLSDMNGTTSASTGGGHIYCDNISGTLNLHTGGGHIEISNFSGEGEAKTSGGNITAALTKITGPLSLSTSAGNIRLQLPLTIAANVQAKGSTVSISKQFKFAGTKNSRHLSGTLNGGGAPVSLSCGYGNVTITHE